MTLALSSPRRSFTCSHTQALALALALVHMLPLTLTLTTAPLSLSLTLPLPLSLTLVNQVFHMLTEKAWGATYPAQVRS